MSDTVGFISDLPTHLVAAFRATLEEVLEADLILHVRDMSDEDNAAQSVDVMRILADLGIDEAEGEKRIIEVWNKVDRLEPEAHDAMMQKASTAKNVIAVSAITGEGVETLMEEISGRLSGVLVEATIALPLDKLALLPWLYSHGIVDGREDHEDGTVSLDVRLSEAESAELERRMGNGQKPQGADW
jgi:GTP-binding protein HflX